MANVQQVCYDQINGLTSAGQDTSICGGGVLDSGTPDALVAAPVRSLGTFSLFYTRIKSPGNSNVSTLQFRVNGGNGNQVLSIGANATGEFTDTVNTDSPSAGQTVNVTLAVSTGSVPFDLLSVIFSASSNTVGRIGASGAALSFSAATFFGFVNGDKDTTETNLQTQMVNACTLQNLSVYCPTKNRSKADTVTLRKNAANAALTVSVTGTGLFEDTSHTVSIVANDKLDYGITVGSGTGTDALTLISVEQSTTDSTFHYINTLDSARTLNFGTTSYLGISGSLTVETTELPTQLALQSAGTLSLLGAVIQANSVNGTTSLTLRKGGADSTLTTSIAASTTGFMQDSTHSPSVAALDEVNYSIVTGGTSGTVTFQSIAMLQTVSAITFVPDEDFETLLVVPPVDPNVTIWQ